MTPDEEARFLKMVEAGRVACEISARHGRNTHLYADKLSAKAAAEGRPEEAEFWTMVAGCIRPRATAEQSGGEKPLGPHLARLTDDE